MTLRSDEMPPSTIDDTSWNSLLSSPSAVVVDLAQEFSQLSQRTLDREDSSPENPFDTPSPASPTTRPSVGKRRTPPCTPIEGSKRFKGPAPIGHLDPETRSRMLAAINTGLQSGDRHRVEAPSPRATEPSPRRLTPAQRSTMMAAIEAGMKDRPADDGTRSEKAQRQFNVLQQLTLTDEQKQAMIGAVDCGVSMFITGKAGTGKTLLLRHIISALKTKHGPEAVAVTAPTGYAACSLGGMTIHSFAGLLPSDETKPIGNVLRRIRSVKTRKRPGSALEGWRSCKVLVIDEVSMVSGTLFQLLSDVGSALRKDIRPFGGMQIVVCGDFFQLPPVRKGATRSTYAFESEVWDAVIARIVDLNVIFRQKDPRLVDMLNNVRRGVVSAESLSLIRHLKRPLDDSDGVSVTHLYPDRAGVELANRINLDWISGPAIRYIASETIRAPSPKDSSSSVSLDQHLLVPSKLRLKIGALVMMVRNLSEDIVNGTLGVVIEFAQVLDSLSPDQWIAVSPDEHASDQAVAKSGKLSTSRIYPVVRFKTASGYKLVLVAPHKFTVEGASGSVMASRTQLPLILAWAISIHKCQGQTLSKVAVHLDHVFENGQAYVALSRARSLEGLQIVEFSRDKVMASAVVSRWMAGLHRLEG